MPTQMSGLGTLAELAARIGGRTHGNAEVRIFRIASIDDAGPGALTFATDARYLRAALASRAEALIVDEVLFESAKDGPLPLLVTSSVRGSLAQLLDSFLPPRPQGPHRHLSAIIDETAVLGEGVVIGPLVVIGSRAIIGSRTILEAGVHIGADAVVGNECWFHPRSMLLDRCIARDRVVLQAGAIIGSDGFGFVPIDARLFKIPQVGIVELGDDVEIGANTCVDRAQTGVTRIGAGTKLDNLIQIGHNVTIGRMTVIAAQTGVAGSAHIGDGVQIGGKSGINGHKEVGSGARVAGNTMVWDDVAAGQTVSGDPAQDHHAELRKKVHIKQLPKLADRVAALEKQVKR